ncbi:sensor histidine kinase [Chloroflexota bacterium]
MRIPIRQYSKVTIDVIQSPHFWAIVLIVLAISFVYYAFYYTEGSLNSDWRYLFRELAIIEIRYDIYGSLFYITFIYAALAFWWRGILITWLVTLVIMLPNLLYVWRDTPSMLANILFLTSPLLLVTFINAEIRWRERDKKILSERDAERQAYVSRVLEAQEDERQRIAQELHDDTTQTLLVIANHANTITTDESTSKLPQVAKEAEWIRDTALRLSDDVRRLSLDLRPSVLDDLGLEAALRWLLNGLNQDTGVETEIVVKGKSRKLRSEIDVTLFRVVQEALNNVRRHSNAAKVMVTLGFHPETVKVEIQDDGVGFSRRITRSELSSSGKLGILGMRQRAKSFGGTFHIHSQSGGGTSVSIEIVA